MKPSSHRKWISKNLLSAKPPSARIAVEELEGRWVPTSVAPGNYTGNILTNTEFDQAGTYTITGNLNIVSGKTLTIGASGVNVVINSGFSVIVAGALNVNNPSSFAIKDTSFGGANAFFGIQVSSGGSFTSTNAMFSRFGGTNGTRDVSQILVNVGGSFTATNSTFDWDDVILRNNSTLNTVTNNAFDGNLSVQAKFVPILDAGTNKRFNDIFINSGTTTDTELTLAPIGVNTTNQRYVFPANFSVVATTTLNVASNSKIIINSGVTLSVAGSLNVTSPTSFEIQDTSFGGANTFFGVQINSGGTFVSANTMFTRFGGTNGTRDFSRILVNTGGSFAASNSTFDWDQVEIRNSSIIDPGSITNNAFDGVLFVQDKVIPILDAGSNKRFRDVMINGGTSSNKVLTLAPLGVDTTNQKYVFYEDFTVSNGNTLNVAANSNVVINSGINLIAAGTLNVTSPTLFAIQDINNGGANSFYGIQVNSGGAVVATNTTFTRLGGSNGSRDNSRILVNTGGQLIARGSSFNIDQVVLATGSRADAQYNFFNTNLFVNSGTVIANNAIRNNDFSPVAVIASGATGSAIDLTNNYWGTTVNAVIDGRITDQKDTAALPLVNYLPVLADRPVNTQAATPAPINFAPAAATSIPLSAIITSPTSTGPANVTLGTITFRLLQGGVLVGTAVTVNVINGVANATYNLPAGSNAGSYNVEATYNGSGFAVSVDATQTLIVNPIAQTITFTGPAPVTFGVTSVSLAATSDSGLDIVYRVVSGFGNLSGSTLNITGAGNIELLATQPGNGNFTAATSVQRTFVVNKTTQSITFNAPAPATFANGLMIDLSAISSVTGLPVSFVIVNGLGTISGTTLSVTGVGSIVVRASQVGDDNTLPASTVDRTFVINQSSQSITFTAPAPVVFAPGLTVNLSATASSSLDVIFTVVSGPGTLTGNVLSVTGADDIVIESTQAGNANFTAATAVQQTLSVARGSQTITFTAPAPSTFAPGLTVNLSATGGASGNAVVFSVARGPGTVSGSVLTITGAGDIVIDANQAGNANFNAATAVQSTVTVNKAAQTIVFATPAPTTFAIGLTINLNATGGITGNPVTYTLVSGPGSILDTVLTVTGVGDIEVRADQSGNANILDATISRTFTITPLSQTIAFAALPSVGFAAGTTVNLSATGGASGNAVTFSVVQGPGTIANNILTVTGAGDIVVRADQAGSGNFSAAVGVSQTLTVTKATQTIAFAAPAGSLPFGSAPQTLTGSSSSTLAVTFAVISGPGTIAGNVLTIAGAGPIVVEVSQAGDGNFNPAVSTRQTFTIDKLTQAITFAPLTPVRFSAGRTVPLVATGGASGVAVVFTVVSGPGTISGNTLTITGDGTIVVQANQLGSDNYTAAASVLQNLSVTRPTESLVGVPQFAVGSDAGGSNVTLYNPDKSVRFSVTAFPGFTGGVRTASADFNRDGVADIIVGSGPGQPTQVRILDGKTLAELFSIAPFEASFIGGVYISAGDVTGDGIPDLAITPDEGGGPRVDIYSGAAGFPKLTAFFGIDDTNFRGGARSTIADMTGDGVADLIVVAGFGGGPRVAAFDGKSLSGTPVKIFGDFFAFEQALRNGIFVTAGDINGDGFADLIAGGGPGGGPRVLAFDGKSLLNNEYVNLANFFGGNVDSRGGIRVAVKDLDGDTKADLIVGSGAGAGNHVTGYLGKNIAANGTPAAEFDFDALAGFTDGVFVG